MFSKTFKSLFVINVSRRLFCTAPIPKKMCFQIGASEHIPVLANEALKYLALKPGQIILDMTFGAGGHSRKILESAPGIQLLALDCDPVALNHMRRLSEEYPSQITPLFGRFSDLPFLMKRHKIDQNSIDAIIFDFGCSSIQFDDSKRGFALSKEGPLDMRMDSGCFNSITAADVLANCKELDLYRIIKTYGEEKYARSIARAIVEARYLFKPLRTTLDLADLVDSVCGNKVRHDKLQRRSHNATKTFQAIRIFVNDELNQINYGMLMSHRLLTLGGRIVTITFHSLEDTIVKRHLQGNSIKNEVGITPLKYVSYSSTDIDDNVVSKALELNWKCLHKHVIVPSCDEVEENPRSRSAKLRAAVKIK